MAMYLIVQQLVPFCVSHATLESYLNVFAVPVAQVDLTPLLELTMYM